MQSELGKFLRGILYLHDSRPAMRLCNRKNKERTLYTDRDRDSGIRGDKGIYMCMNVCARVCACARVCSTRNRGGEEFFENSSNSRPVHNDPPLPPRLSQLVANFQLVPTRSKNPRPGNSLFRDFHEFSFSSFFLVLLLFLLLLGEGATPPLDIISNDWTTNNRDPPTTARVAGDVGTFARRNVRILLHSIAGLCLRRAQSESRG